MQKPVLSFKELEASQLMLAGGKALNLGRLSRIDGIQVPEGFCVTTAVYRQTVAKSKVYQSLVGQLKTLSAGDREQIAAISRQIRQIILETALPVEVTRAVVAQLSSLGEGACLCRTVQRNCRRSAACLFLPANKTAI